jgi:hypothetical protein
MATTLRNIFDGVEKASTRLVAGTSLGEVVASSAAVGAAIAGLAGASPVIAAATATIGIGGALLLEGGAIGARFTATLRRREGDSLTTGDVAGALAAELIAAIVGLPLGVLAAVGIAPMALLPTAALVFSAGLLLGSAALPHATFTTRDGISIPPPPRDLLFGAAAAQIAVGLVASALAVVALLGTAPLTLSLVALLLLAVSELLSGAVLGAGSVGSLPRFTPVPATTRRDPPRR